MGIDPINWKVEFEKDFGADNGYIREWIPNDEDINSWSKLLTIKFVEDETSISSNIQIIF